MAYQTKTNSDVSRHFFFTSQSGLTYSNSISLTEPTSEKKEYRHVTIGENPNQMNRTEPPSETDGDWEENWENARDWKSEKRKTERISGSSRRSKHHFHSDFRRFSASLSLGVEFPLQGSLVNFFLLLLPPENAFGPPSDMQSCLCQEDSEGYVGMWWWCCRQLELSEFLGFTQACINYSKCQYVEGVEEIVYLLVKLDNGFPWSETSRRLYLRHDHQLNVGLRKE